MIFFLEILFSKNEHFDNFNSFMNQEGILKLNVEFFQYQYDEEFKSKGDFYFYNKNYYTFDSPIQRIIYDNDIITSINKVDKQIIYEQAISNEFTIFDIMNGKIDPMFFNDIVFFGDIVRISFKIDEWSINGSLFTDIDSGRPRKLEIKIGKSLNTMIEVLQVDRIGHSDLPIIDSALFRIIDFRE